MSQNQSQPGANNRDIATIAQPSMSVLPLPGGVGPITDMTTSGPSPSPQPLPIGSRPIVANRQGTLLAANRRANDAASRRSTLGAYLRKRSRL